MTEAIFARANARENGGDWLLEKYVETFLSYVYSYRRLIEALSISLTSVILPVPVSLARFAPNVVNGVESFPSLILQDLCYVPHPHFHSSFFKPQVLSISTLLSNHRSELRLEKISIAMPVKWTPETDQIVRNSVSSLLLLLGAISLSFPKSQLILLMLPSCFWKFLKRHMWTRMRRPSLQLGVSSFIFYNFASLADLIYIYIFLNSWNPRDTHTPCNIWENFQD